MEKGDRKRPREKADGPTTKTPPAYGSQEYWEERYKKLQKQVEVEDKQEEEEKEKDEKEPDPFHAWYFTYEELVPLILPLIVGDVSSNEASKYSHTQEDDEEEEKDNQAATRTKRKDPEEEETKQIENNPPSGTDSTPEKVEEDDDDNVENGDGGDDQDGIDENEEEEEEEESAPTREGLAKHGPIEILEVGCGDVPLGNDIIHGVKELEGAEGKIIADKILKSVICIDYSKTVIDAMKAKQQSEGLVTPSISLEYACEDARKLPYANERFHFILEKGTMDAMLSDSDKGSENCRSIVSEMARVVARGGKTVCP